MIIDQCAWRAALSPQRPALHFGGRWYSQAELAARAGQLAGALAAQGVGPGDRVGILAHNHIAHIDLINAAARLGCIYTPFNTRLPAAEQAGLMADIAPALLLHDAEHAGTARGGTAPRLSLDDYPDFLAEAPPLEAPTAPRPEDTAMILFTGGSTGQPKGAMLPYRQMFYNTVNTCLGWAVGAEDCVIQCTPAFHAALNALATPLLAAGGRVVMQRSFDPGEYLALVEEHRATLMFMVPTMFQMLAEHPDFARRDLSSVRWAISGGAPCPGPVREAFVARGIRFKQGYGMTEAGVNCFAIDLDAAAERPQSVGVPMPHARAVIRSPDGQPVAQGEVGELTLAGPHVFSGYWKNPAATAEALRDGWLWTGDLARQDEKGYFAITGRRKEMFISGGENVYPVEIENALYAVPEVAECAVLGVPHPRWGEVGLAAVVLRPGAALSAEDLQARLKAQLAGYKRPREWLFLDALPKSGAGKILKPVLRARWEATRDTARDTHTTVAC